MEFREKTEIMLGNEAIARGLYEAGVEFASAYPGTPSTEINQELAKYDGIYCEWSSNEKVALESALGASIVGRRSVAIMKHVGLNVACDPLFASAYSGINGGMIVIVADDPGIYSSQNEQDTRRLGRAAGIPVVEPSSCEEAKEMIKKAYDMSEKYQIPVIFRTTMRLSHSRGIVTVGCRQNRAVKKYVKNEKRFVLLPEYSRKLHVELKEKQKRIATEKWDFFENIIEPKNERGFVTSGIAYQYVKEVFPDIPILKVNMPYPLNMKNIIKFSEIVEKIYVFEELEPVIEEQIQSFGISCYGKKIFNNYGEYSVQMLRDKIENVKTEDKSSRYDLPIRRPALCEGCSHKNVYNVLKKMNLHVVGDIGCYTLGALEPFKCLDTCLCMGASISMLHGILSVQESKSWIAVIGDGTFWHTGINSLINMVYNSSKGTVLIMNNFNIAMTGHQGHPGTGKRIISGRKGKNAISLKSVCAVIGVEHVREVDATDEIELEKIIKSELEFDGISVIIVNEICTRGK